MKKRSMLIALLLSITLISVAQKKSTNQMLEEANQVGKMVVEPTNKPVNQFRPLPVVTTKLDTVTTLCLVLVNVQTGQSQTMWLTKIFGNIYDFPTPNSNDLKRDSLIIKKQLIPIKRYFAATEQEIIDPKTKKKSKQQQSAPVPEDIILIDFNNNFTRK